MTISYSGDNIAFSDGSSIGSGRMGMVNRIINGRMEIDQRNNGALISIGSGGVYTVDRFQLVNSQASKMNAQQNLNSITPPLGFTNYLGIVSTSAYSLTAGDYFTLQQPIEGFNTTDFGWGAANAKTVTLSFLVYSSLTGTFGGALYNSAADRSYPFAYTISSANTWTQISITIAGDTTGTWLTNNGAGIRVNWGLGVGSTISGTAGAWATGLYRSATGATSVVGTNGATFYITGVDLRPGTYTTAPTWEFRSYQQEDMLCKRYFEKLSGGINSPGIGGASCAANWVYKVTKRATPTVTGYSATDSVVPYIDTAYAQSTAAAATWGSGSTATAEL